MFLNLRITSKDKSTRDVKAEWADFIAFEDEFDQAFTIVLDPKKSRLKHLTWLSWHAESRDQKTKLSFQDWCKDIAQCGFVVGNEVEDIDPLESKAPTGA